MTSTDIRTLPAQLSHAPSQLAILWRDGKHSEYDSTWLRDNAPENRDPQNGQRLVSILDIPDAPRLSSASISSDGYLSVSWEDAHKTAFSFDWLREHDPSSPAQVRPERRPWRSQPISSFHWSNYSSWVNDEDERLAWLTDMASDGIALLRNVPTVDSTVLTVARHIGYVRETNYGLQFEVRSMARPNNLAYTSLALPVHTDNPYRDPVPGLQLLHCLSNAGQGGESIFVDGLQVAVDLTTHDSDAFEALARTPIRYRFQDDGTDLACERTLIELDVRGSFRAIYYNDRSIAPFPLTGSGLGHYYGAYRKLAKLLRDPGYAVCCRLDPGDLVVFDNTRTLHGRTGFSVEHGVRHLQGCYVDADALYSAVAVRSRKEPIPCL